MWKSAYDCVNPEDPEGRTYKEINLAKSHKIPCGTLVELDDGVRLWVVHLNRDCDGTPVYYLSPNRDDPQETPGKRNKTWTGACSEIRLTPVQQHQAIRKFGDL